MLLNVYIINDKDYDKPSSLFLFCLYAEISSPLWKCKPHNDGVMVWQSIRLEGIRRGSLKVENLLFPSDKV